jgi:hypothetical protein
MKSSRPGKGNSRPKLPKVSEEMKAWSAALLTEVAGWPQVVTRPFFGLTAVYRRSRIFAVLPRTRAFGTANSLGFKLQAPQPRILARVEQDARIAATEMQKARWFRLELRSPADLRDALNWLSDAYEAGEDNRKRR